MAGGGGGPAAEDAVVKYGLAVAGVVGPDAFAANTNLEPGQILVLSKALGTGILATAIKAGWDGAEALARELVASAARLNKGPARAIREPQIRAATDITGFGLGGHLLEMAEASDVAIDLDAGSLPALPRAIELAGVGLLPAGCYANRRYRQKDTAVGDDVDPLLVDLVFDPQTSGGIVLAVPPGRLDDALAILKDEGDLGRVIGAVVPADKGPRLRIGNGRNRP